MLHGSSAPAAGGETTRSARAELLRAAAAALQGHRDVAIVDVPGHENAGDHLLYLAQRSLLRALDVRVRYSCSFYTYDPDELARSLPHGAVVMQGGGNLGDLYPPHQHVRERVVADFPDRRLVVLPQSVHFLDPAQEQRALVAMTHDDLVVLLRHRDDARRWADVPGVAYSPDTALALTRLPRVAPTKALSAVLREDVETAAGDLGERLAARGWDAADWALDARGGRLVQLGRALQKSSREAPEAARQRLRLAGYDAAARARVGSAARLVGSGQVVVTDRMHAMVLAILMGRPTVAVDNSYGKVSRTFTDLGLGGIPGTHLARSPAHAVELLEQLGVRQRRRS